MTEPVSTDAAHPTAEILEYFEQRTRAHIARVAANLYLLAEGSPHREELIERARLHDASKFSPAERIPYAWLTESKRHERAGRPFRLPDGVREQIREAVRHHFATNRHHPEFHESADDMTEIDIIEMVCDWTAMSQEFEQDGGSARGWADKTVGVRFQLNDAKTQFLYETIDELDRRVAGQQNPSPSQCARDEESDGKRVP